MKLMLRLILRFMLMALWLFPCVSGAQLQEQAAAENPAPQAPQLHVIYTYSKELIGELLAAFARENHLQLKAEFKEQNALKAEILGMVEQNKTPDAIIMPADHVGLHGFVHYSLLNTQMFHTALPERLWDSARSDGQIYGVPLLQGNHLMLYYNKSLVSKAATSWQELLEQKTQLQAKGISAIAWSYEEAYWFLPFLGGYGGWPLVDGKVQLNTPAMEAAITFYKGLYDQQIPYPDCSYQCAVNLFKAGKVAYTINGDWIGSEFESALGDKLGVSAIPAAEGHKLIPTFSTHVLAFPNNSLEGPKRAQLLALANYLQSEKVQQALWQKGGAIPVNPAALAKAKANATGYRVQMLALMEDTRSLPADQQMTFIWDVIGKGFIRYREGALSAPAAAQYMQKLAERYIRNAQREQQGGAPAP